MFDQPVRGRGLGQKVQPKLVVPEVPFKFNPCPVGAALKMTNFEFLYQQLYAKVKSKQKATDTNFISDKEFHSCI